jgi:hypothetical protein
VDKNWVRIYSTSANYKAELLKGLLMENDINAIILNKQDSAYLFGEFELYVLTDELVKAQHIISTQEQF